MLCKYVLKTLTMVFSCTYSYINEWLITITKTTLFFNSPISWKNIHNVCFMSSRYGLDYLRKMECRPNELLLEFMKWNRVMNHNPGTWNGIWSHMYIETNFLRNGHEAGDLNSATFCVARWALSLHIRSQLRGDLATMKDGRQDKIVTNHKEECDAKKTDRCRWSSKYTGRIDHIHQSNGHVKPTFLSCEYCYWVSGSK